MTSDVGKDGTFKALSSLCNRSADIDNPMYTSVYKLNLDLLLAPLKGNSGFDPRLDLLVWDAGSPSATTVDNGRQLWYTWSSRGDRQSSRYSLVV